MGYWLLKTEADSYGWNDLLRDGGTEWDGVRNAAAAGHLRRMQPGERALFYHSGSVRAAVGVVRTVRGARAEGESNWVSVAIAPDAALPRPVPLAAMRADPALAGLAMLRQPRLSVSPVSDAEWAAVMRLAGPA